MNFYEWSQLAEAKKNEEKLDTQQLKCLMDMVTALKDIFKKTPKTTREKAWDKLTGKEGQKQMHNLLKSPNYSLSNFHRL